VYFFSSRRRHTRFSRDWSSDVCSFDLDLKCLVRNKDRRTVEDQPFMDSIVVYKTKGVYDPILKKWKGSGGTLNWQKVGLDKNKKIGRASCRERVKIQVLAVNAGKTTPY